MKLESLRRSCTSRSCATSTAPRTRSSRRCPRWPRPRTAPELKAAFEEHLEQTKGHVERLETIFEGLGEKPKGQEVQGDGGARRGGQGD